MESRKLQLIGVSVRLLDPQPPTLFIVVGDTFMKSLIVLAALATLLGSVTGCSMLNRSGVQSRETCDPTSSEPFLSRLRLPQISLPWRRAKDFDDDSAECSTCNEGFSEVGYSDSGYSNSGFVDGQVIGDQSYGGQIIEGQVISGPIEGQIIGTPVISEGFMGSNSGSQTLYHPETVGPISTPNISTKYVGELIPAPSSPAVDLGK